MAETLVLTAPITYPSTTSWSLVEFSLRKSPWQVRLGLSGPNGESKSINFEGSEAQTYIVALNKRNATVTSNEKWTLNLLVTNRYLPAGSVSGTPD